MAFLDLLAYLAESAEIRNRILLEASTMVSKYDDSDTPLHLRLSAVPLEGWESLKFLDQCIKEGIRLNIQGLALRRAEQDEMIGDTVVNKGDFIVS